LSDLILEFIHPRVAFSFADLLRDDLPSSLGANPSDLFLVEGSPIAGSGDGAPIPRNRNRYFRGFPEVSLAGSNESCFSRWIESTIRSNS
jgi:hypothetical protein